jgi:hypothetical protein
MLFVPDDGQMGPTLARLDYHLIIIEFDALGGIILLIFKYIVT